MHPRTFEVEMLSQQCVGGKVKACLLPESRPAMTVGEPALPVCVNQEAGLLAREWAELNSKTISASPLALGLSFSGQLDLPTLQGTVNELINRHSALRASFLPSPAVSPEERRKWLYAFGRTGLFVPGLYRQAVAGNVELPLCEVDLAGLAPPEQAAEIERICAERLKTPFDYARPPLMRAALLRIKPDEHLLILVVDHLVSDAWSMRVIAAELRVLYGQISGAAPDQLPPVPRGLPDYAVWQHEQMQTSSFDRAAEYWRQQWSEFGSCRLTFSDFPFALPPPKTPTFAFDSARLSLEPDLAAASRRLARGSKVTLHILFLAALAILLRQCTGLEKIAVWNHFADRSRPEFRNAVGCFWTTHLVGVDLTADPSASEALLRAREVISQGLTNERLPLPLLWLMLRCRPCYPDAQILLDSRTEDWREGPSVAGGVVIRRATLPKVLPPRFSTMGIYVNDTQQGTSLSAQYAVDLYSPEGIRALLHDLCGVIGQLVEEPVKKVSRFSLGELKQANVNRAIGRPEMSEFVIFGSDRIPALPQR
jgi:hypothetical protein